jgi:UDP-N-acetylglucosamine--N-acetylmuramyl-(pentapeptide) pyrophosphoryl-undecaprenol N-acetylglucosamine transferase
MTPKFLFAAGGTGGHIFPALAVADRLRAIEPKSTIEFIGTRGRLEEKTVPRAGYPLNFLWISGLERKLSLQTLLLPGKLAVSFMQMAALIRRVRPHAIVCAGAYVSYPAGMVGSMMGIPVVLMESNAFPGLVTRKLAPRARQIHVAFDEAVEALRPDAGKQTEILVSGNPVRGIFLENVNRAEARKHFGLDPERPTLFAFGGSLGARSINAALDAIVDRLLDSGIQVIWQTGTSYAGGEKKGGGLYRSTFIHEMQLGYAAADLVLARAGATTAAELAVVGKPSILVPIPIATVHQLENAQAMEKAGAARMLEDGLLAEKLEAEIRELLADPQRLGRMGECAGRIGVPDADERIARHLLALVG